MSKKHLRRNTANVLSASCEHYLDTIGQEALARAGNNPQLKGIVHEFLFRDKLNLNISNRLQGNVAMLTRNPYAHSVDVVLLNKNGRAIGRYQLKDTTSTSGVQDTLQKVRSGRYKKTKLIGTNETTEKYNQAKNNSDQTMESSRISSNRTGRIADNAGVNSPDKNLLWNNLKDVGSCAMNSAMFGAAIAGSKSLFEETVRYRNGEINKAELVGNIALETGKGAVSAGCTTAAALTLKEAGKALGKRVGNESLRKLAGSNAGTAVAFGLVEIGCDTVSLVKGDLNAKDFGKKVMATTGSAAGGYGGALAGAALGTALFPGVGTAIGGFIGSLAGSLSGNTVCGAISDWLFD